MVNVYVECRLIAEIPRGFLTGGTSASRRPTDINLSSFKNSSLSGGYSGLGLAAAFLLVLLVNCIGVHLSPHVRHPEVYGLRPEFIDQVLHARAIIWRVVAIQKRKLLFSETSEESSSSS